MSGLEGRSAKPVESEADEEGDWLGWNRTESTAAAEGPAVPEAGAPGSPEHKAARWAEYQERDDGAGWSYERWSSVYDANMERCDKANEAVDRLHQELGWGTREVTVDVEGVARRLDIADFSTREAIEVKTGYTYASEAIQWQVLRDRVLVEDGWDIAWYFDQTPSRPLSTLLDESGIRYQILEHRE